MPVFVKERPLHLLLTTDAVGGVWTYSLDLAAALQTENIRVTLAVIGPQPNAGMVTQAQQFANLDLVIVDAALDWLAQTEDDVELACERLAELARARRVDLVQVHSPALVAFASFPAPIVSVVHSCVATWWEAVRGGALPADLTWRAKLVAHGLQRAHVNVAPTQSFAIAIARQYGCEPPVCVHNGRRPHAAPSDTHADFAFTSGRFWDESKGIATLDAAAQTCGVPVVAAGPLESPFGGEVALRNIDARGALPGETVREILRSRPLFVSSAVYEPFGLSVLEAAQAGCALVLSAIPTFQELWTDAALFVPPRDAQALAAGLRALAEDADWRSRLGEAARARALELTPERQASAMAAIYRRVLSSVKGREEAA